MSQLLPLSVGNFAVVDDTDFDRANAFAWYESVRPHTSYAAMNVDSALGIRTVILLHRFILGLCDPKLEVDHINSNGLDCRRENMRIFERYTCRGNCSNKRSSHNSRSKYKGVSFDSRGWTAQISFGTRKLRTRSVLGRFRSEEDAARAYDAAACDIFGSSSLLNFGDYASHDVESKFRSLV